MEFMKIIKQFRKFVISYRTILERSDSSTALNLASYNSLTILKSVIMDPVQLSLAIVTFVLYLV